MADGAHTNGAFALAYGFVPLHNEHDAVAVSLASLLRAAAAGLPAVCASQVEGQEAGGQAGSYARARALAHACCAEPDAAAARVAAAGLPCAPLLLRADDVDEASCL